MIALAPVKGGVSSARPSRPPRRVAAVDQVIDFALECERGEDLGDGFCAGLGDDIERDFGYRVDLFWMNSQTVWLLFT